MRPSFPRLRSHARVLCAIAIFFALTATAVVAQFGTFNPAFDGELWGVRYEITPADDGIPGGLAFSNGTLFVVDMANQTVLAYDSAGNLVPTANHDWNAADAGSPVFGFSLNQLLATSISVDGTPRRALLVSDGGSNRVAAFDTTGAYLFTLRLERPTNDPLYQLSIGQLALSPGAQFSLNTITHTLTLAGNFAAAWFEQIATGSVDSGAMVFQGPTSFPLVGSEFHATPVVIKRGNEHDPVEPAPLRVYAVVYDQNGNLFMLDLFTERLHAYDAALNHLFSFGTPVVDGTSAEFHEPWGMAYWPDAAGSGGRLFINDTYKSRIMVYRPSDGPDLGSAIDGLELESTIKGFLPPHPAIYPFTIALDTASGSIAMSDFAEDVGSYPRAVVLQQPGLATFNLETLDASGAVVQSVCTDAGYNIRFSLTVPSGRPPANNVVPQLLIDGVPAAVVPMPADIYPSPMTLSAGEVATFTYMLTAPHAAGDLAIVAGATASTPDISQRAGTVSVADCAGESDPSTITAAPSTPPQVSGWTPVLEGETFSVELTAQDDDGIESIEYQLEGANESGEEPIEIEFDGLQTDAVADVPFAEFGRTTLTYRVRDGNGIRSAWQTLNVRTKLVTDRGSNENEAVEFRVGDPEGSSFTFSAAGLPPGVAFSEATGQITGVIQFNAHDPYSADPAAASGIYHVVVTEHGPGGTSSVAFTWTINHINRPPTITPVNGFSVNQGEEFSLDIEGFDPDGDPAFWTVGGIGVHTGQDLPPSITIDPTSGLIHGTFPIGSDTEYIVRVGLSECATVGQAPPCQGLLLPGEHLATLSSITVGVVNSNHPPDIVNPGPQSSAEGDAISLQIQVSDAEGDDLTFQAGGLPAGLTIDTDTGVITGTISFDAAGSYAVTVKVDDHVNTPVRSVTFAWTVTATNRPPVVSIPDRVDIETTTIAAGTSISGFASDPDGSPVTFVSAVGLPPGIALAPTGALSGSLDFSSAGVYTVTVRVSDGAAFTDDSFTWTIFNRNREPQLEVQDRSSGEGDVVAYQLPASDPDGDPLQFSINGLPPGLVLNPSTGLITGTLGYNSAGVYTVNVGVGDVIAEGSLSILRTFKWTIVDNRSPQANADAATAMQGASVSIDVRGNDTDPDNDALSIVSVTAPTNGGLAVINAVNGTIIFTAPPPPFLGTSTFSYTVTDGELTSTAVVTVTIILSNAPPVCSAATGGEIWPPNHKKFYVASINGVYDPDRNPITIKVTGIWQDEPLDSTGDGQFSPDGRIENGQAWIRAERNGHGNKAAGNGRVYEILFTATDTKGASCTGSVFWTVPHDQGQRSTAIDDGIRYDSTGVIPGARNKSQIHP